MLVYSASLYAAPSDFKNEPVVSQPNIKAKDEKIEDPKEDKKALGRFIDKIFDKRKREERKKAKKGEAEKEGWGIWISNEMDYGSFKITSFSNDVFLNPFDIIFLRFLLSIYFIWYF